MSDAALAIIPARFDSSRFPGKVLADRTGKPLIQHVYERVVRASRVGVTLVATDDRRVLDAVAGFGGEAVMTRADHPNGTSRLAEVAATRDESIIVNVQGDEPEIDPAHIDKAIDALDADPDAEVSTLAAPFEPGEDPSNPNIVKVVRAEDTGRAISFSRAEIPHPRGEPTPPLKHVGLYVYRRGFLLQYPTLPETPHERSERLEQLRWLEHGHAISVVVVNRSSHGIDTPEQYDEFVRRYSVSSVW